MRIRNKLRRLNPGTLHQNDAQAYANSESHQQEMEFDTIPYRSCPNGGYFTSSERRQKDGRLGTKSGRLDRENDLTENGY